MTALPNIKHLAAHTLLRCLLPLLMAGAVASCHKGSTVKPHRDYHYSRGHDGRHNRSRDGDNHTSHTREQWAKLDVELTAADNAALYSELRSWLGTPYKYAASERGRGTDCSGMVMKVYQAVYDISLERNSAKMCRENCTRIARESLGEGDLVFFNGGSAGKITHVGIYLKDGYFCHTSSSRGVMVSHLDDNYWRTHYECAGRVTSRARK